MMRQAATIEYYLEKITKRLEIGMRRTKKNSIVGKEVSISSDITEIDT